MNSRAFSRLSWRMNDEVPELIDDPRRIGQALGRGDHVVHLGLTRAAVLKKRCMVGTNA